MKISTLKDLSSYVMQLTYQNSGFRLDAKKVSEYESKIGTEEIPNLPEKPDGAIPFYTSVNRNYATLIYMLTRTFGGEYGTDFGIWTDNGRMYKRWIRVAPLNALAMIYFERHIMGMLVGQTVVNELGRTIVRGQTLMTDEIDKKWAEVMGQIGRRFAMAQRSLLNQLAKSKVLTIEDVESFMYELELAHEISPKPSENAVEGIKFQENWREASFNVIREGYGNPEEEDLESLEKLFKESK